MTAPMHENRSTIKNPVRDSGGAVEGGSAAEQLLRSVTGPLSTVLRALPRSPLPVALGTGALVVAGVLDLPVAGALGLGYLTLRTWRQGQH